MEQFRGRVLPESVGKRLETMCALGRLDLAELDERAFDELKELNEDAALVVLEHFANSDLSHVQNKSAFLCGMIKTHGEKQQQGTTQNDLPAAQADQGGADEEKVRELLDRTGYSLDISKGQRKYGGPPPGWEGPPPPTGASGCCQVFVGKIPRDMYEDELVPPFEEHGQIYDFRLMMDPQTSQNKGYGFVTYANHESAKNACKALDNSEIRKNRRLRVCISVANDRLFVGFIPKSKTKDDILEEFRQHTDNLKDVIVYMSAEDSTRNRGFAFLEFETHKDAAQARRRLMGGRVKVWGHVVPTCDWADPQEEPDEETMAKVRVLHVRNVSPNTTDENLISTFSEYGEVERVKKLKGYAFVHYKERESALKAIAEMNGKTLDGLVIEVSLAKPSQNKDKRQFGRGGDMRGRGAMRGGPRGRGRGGYGGGYGGGYNEGYGGYDSYSGNYDNYSYGGGYDDGYGGYDDGYGSGGYSGGYESGYGGGYESSYGGGYNEGYSGGYSRGAQRGRGGPGGPRDGRGGARAGPPGRGGRGGPRGGQQGGGPTEGKRKFDGEGTVSYPEPKRQFNQPGTAPIAQQPLESNDQSYSGAYDQSNQWYQDSSYQQWN